MLLVGMEVVQVDNAACEQHLHIYQPVSGDLEDNMSRTDLKIPDKATRLFVSFMNPELLYALLGEALDDLVEGRCVP